MSYELSSNYIARNIIPKGCKVDKIDCFYTLTKFISRFSYLIRKLSSFCLAPLVKNTSTKKSLVCQNPYNFSETFEVYKRFNASLIGRQ